MNTETPYDTFLQLHYMQEPLLIGNVWDVVSAKAFERQGFSAIATSSAAVAHTMGYDDGEQLPFDLLLQIVDRIIKNANIPLSVDMEGGYSNSLPGIFDNIEKLYTLGVVGINIEDSSKNIKGQLTPLSEFQAIISGIADHLFAKNMNMFINVRTDAFIHKLPSPIEETIMRVKVYEAAGASGIFVPFLQAEEEIKAIVQSTRLPVNVFSTPQLPTFAKLSALGVKRISMGRAAHRALTTSLEKMISTIKEDQCFGSLYF